MKVAQARYGGRKGEHVRQMPDGERVRFRAAHRTDPWVGIESVEYARFIEDLSNYEVDWTARGRLAAHGRAVLELGYQKKRSIASDLDLSFDGQPDEDEVDEAIEGMIDSLENQGGL